MDFHLLEKLNIHSYQAKIIAIFKILIYQHVFKKFKLHSNQVLSNWYGQLKPEKWIADLD